MTEYEKAIAVAARVLERPDGNPDEDLAVLARQFVRADTALRTMRSEMKVLFERLTRLSMSAAYRASAASSPPATSATPPNAWGARSGGAELTATAAIVAATISSLRWLLFDLPIQ